MRDLGVVEYLKDMKAEGKIKYLGFSFHDGYEVFEEIINYTDWDFCQIQLNYMDTDEQAGMKGYKLAESKNIPVVIMEPIKGGLLANLPEAVTQPFTELDPNKSIASWTLRWVASLPNVKVVLSGMSDYEQVKDNLDTFCDFKEMTAKENEAVEKVAESLKKRVNNGCTGCRYCMPCPAGVNIPQNFAIWNRFGIYENAGNAKWQWNNEIPDAEKAKNCIKCGKCEGVCPQKLKIRDDLECLQKEFDKL